MTDDSFSKENNSESATEPSRPASMKDALVLVAIYTLLVFAVAIWVRSAAGTENYPTGESLMLDLAPIGKLSVGALSLAAVGAVGSMLAALAMASMAARVPFLPKILRPGYFLEVGVPNPLARIVVLALVAPAVEECLFRGVIVQGFLTRYRPTTALLLGAVLFGIGHIDPWQAFNATLIGFFLGFVFMRTMSIVPSFVAHGLYNALVYAMAGGASGHPAKLFSVFYRSISSAALSLAAGLTIVAVAMVLLYKTTSSTWSRYDRRTGS